MWEAILKLIKPVLEFFNRQFRRKDEKEKREKDYRKELKKEMDEAFKLKGVARTRALNKLRSKL